MAYILGPGSAVWEIGRWGSGVLELGSADDLALKRNCDDQEKQSRQGKAEDSLWPVPAHSTLPFVESPIKPPETGCTYAVEVERLGWLESFCAESPATAGVPASQIRHSRRRVERNLYSPTTAATFSMSSAPTGAAILSTTGILTRKPITASNKAST